MLNSQAAELLKRFASVPALETVPVEVRRRLMLDAVPATGEVTELDAVEEVRLDTAVGEVPVRVYWPQVSPGLPVVAFAHGGAWSAGDLDTHDRFARDLALESGAVVVAIGYRLAPEHPFPAGLDDCVGVLRRLVKDGGGLGIDPARVAVCGESAGATLLAAACQQVRDGIVHQALFYPPTDLAGIGETESYRAYGEGYFSSARDLAFNARQYAGDADLTDPRISPLRAADVSGLPPATIVTAEFDAFRDEAEAYGERLREAGIAATVRRFPGQIHAFASFAGVIDDGAAARSWVAGELHRALF